MAATPVGRVLVSSRFRWREAASRVFSQRFAVTVASAESFIADFIAAPTQPGDLSTAVVWIDGNDVGSRHDRERCVDR